MAKGKERPTASAGTNKGAASRSATTTRPAPERPTQPAPAARPPAGGNGSPRLSPEEVYRLIQESAYFKAKARNFAPGHEVQDWIEAEAEVRRRLERAA
jgi:hypothetical protein